MKILYINSVYGYGSTGKIVRKLRDEALKAGHEAYVIYGRKSAIGYKGSTAEADDVWYIADNLEQKADIAASVLFDSHGLHSRKNTEKIIAKIEEIRPDVIHLHNIHGFYLNYEMLFEYLKKEKIPVVWTLHDCWAYTGFCAYYDYNECGQWKNGCKECHFRNEYPYRLLSSSAKNFERKKKAWSHMNMVLVTPSKWLKGEVSESILKNYPCRVIYNDVSLSDFFYDPGNIREEYHLENKRVYLSCANVWTKQKGYEECRKLASKLNDNEVLVMVGLSEKQMKNVPEHVLGIPHCNIDELRHWYSACDAFFNPTLEDNYPTVNLEANACGAPIVTYNTGGSPESAGRSAAVVARYDTADAVVKLRAAVRQEEIVRDEKKPMSEEYLNLYEQIGRISK